MGFSARLKTLVSNCISALLLVSGAVLFGAAFKITATRPIFTECGADQLNCGEGEGYCEPLNMPIPESGSCLNPNVCCKFVGFCYDNFEQPCNYIQCRPRVQCGEQESGCTDEQCAEVGAYCDPVGGYCYTPILIDTSGNGFQLTDANDGVLFDLDGDGVLNFTSWTTTGTDDAWLALDRNNDGIINSGIELFGNFTPQSEKINRNGFGALAEYDKRENGGNEDGKIDSNDSIYVLLRLWKDTNHNGISEFEELFGLAEMSVMSISLDYRDSRRRDRYGNVFRYRAMVNEGARPIVGRWAYDVFLTGASN